VSAPIELLGDWRRSDECGALRPADVGRAEGEQRQPKRERPGSEGDYEEPCLVPGGVGRGGGDAGQHQREHEKERAERSPLARRSQGEKGCRNHRGTIAASNRLGA